MPGYSLYWQPGCTSCLKAREFLAAHAIAFESINVRTTPGAQQRLAALGARSIPVLVRNGSWIHAQDLDEVARFVGVTLDRQRLPPDVLVLRIALLLDAASRYTRQLSATSLEQTLPGRPDRAGADLALHVAEVIAGLLDAARGAELSYAHFERRPTGAARTPPRLIERQAAVREALGCWWRDNAARPPEAVATYYGRQPFHAVLERTAWHIAQHCRQLESLVREAGATPDGALTAAELGGLPLPEGVWDREIAAAD